MTRTIRRPRRGAFTLVEVLVVVSILAILAALATAAFYRVRASQSISASEATINKLESGLGRKWSAVLDNAKQAGIPDGLVTFAGNDRDRARVLYTYLLLKNEFPTTFGEAGVGGSYNTGLPMNPQATALTVPGYGTVAALPGKAAYAAPVFDYLRRNYPSQAVTVTFGNTAEDSAALLYQALTATGTRGETMTGDGLQGQVGQVTVSIQVNGSAPGTPLTLPAYIDAWGQPISFSRHTFLPELNGREFSKAKQPAAQGGPFRDPIDPFGKLVTPTPGSNNTPAVGVWTVGSGANYSLKQFWAALYPAPSPHWAYDGAFPTEYKADGIPGGNTNPPAFGPHNWQPTLISAGANKKLATAAGANFGGDDDLISVRMAREGNKGN